MYNLNDYNSAPTTLNIPERWERVLAYVFGWISGLILLLVEQRNQTVRRHAAQSVVIFGTLSLIGFVAAVLAGAFGAIPLVGLVLGGVFGVIAGAAKAIGFVMWILLMVLAFFSAKTLITGPRYQRFF
ncbi:MAG TPA: hypothetical protein VFQ25_07625 [Ktedonobacterales bacterium]|nr:hypothetical protein [Ktedonobacterales bacterium]